MAPVKRLTMPQQLKFVACSHQVAHLPLRFRASNTSGTVTVIRRAPSVITPTSPSIVLKKLVRAVLASSYVSMLILLTPAHTFGVVWVKLTKISQLLLGSRHLSAYLLFWPTGGYRVWSNP